MPNGINKTNYYKNKTHITNSMIGDYLKSPEYYAKKHMLNVIDTTPTPAMLMGSAVDCILTEGRDKFDKLYTKKVLKKENAKLFEANKGTDKTILAKDAYEKVEVMAAAVSATPAYKWLEEKSKMQLILTGVINTGLMGGDNVPVKGRPDFVTINHDRTKAWIDDLKTTTDTSARKYEWSCHDFGYFRQACMYKELLKQKYKKLKTIVSRHIVVSRDSNAPQVRVYLLNEERVDAELPKIKEALYKIAVLKDFAPFMPSWDDVVELGKKPMEKTFSIEDVTEL